MEDVIQNAQVALNQFLAFQESYKGEWVVSWMLTHTDVIVFFVVLYLTLILYVPSLMEKKQPMKLKWTFAFWNFLLASFSCVGAFYTIPRLVSTVLNKGLWFSACAEPSEFYFDGAVGFWVTLFILSKVPELVDTVFLVLQKKDVIFLHWFHHVTVMLYCWHAYVHRIGPGLWFAGMNFGVHSIMYTYYFFMAIGARALVKPFAPLITMLQILQMVVGMTVTVLTFVWRQQEDPSDPRTKCHVDAANSRMGLAMYSSYFILFALLFKKLYLTKGGKHSRVGGSSPTVASPTTQAARKAERSVCSVDTEETDAVGGFMPKGSPATATGAAAAATKKKK